MPSELLNATPAELHFSNSLDAPLKGFYTFENSAHGPLFEESARFMEILEKDVLQSKVNLADEKQNKL